MPGRSWSRKWSMVLNTEEKLLTGTTLCWLRLWEQVAVRWWKDGRSYDEDTGSVMFHWQTKCTIAAIAAIQFHGQEHWNLQWMLSSGRHAGARHVGKHFYTCTVNPTLPLLLEPWLQSGAESFCSWRTIVIVCTFHNARVCAGHFEAAWFCLVNALCAHYLSTLPRDTFARVRTAVPLSCCTDTTGRLVDGWIVLN